MSGAGQNFGQLVQDLLDMQDEVQQHAPSLSNTWGYLAAQGKSLASGQQAAITQATWVAQYKAFLVQLTGMDTSTTFAQAVQQGGTTEAVQQLTDSVQHLPTAIANGAVNVATTAGQLVGQAAGSAIGAAGSSSGIGPALQSALPWIVLGIAAIVLVPIVLKELEK